MKIVDVGQEHQEYRNDMDPIPRHRGNGSPKIYPPGHEGLPVWYDGGCKGDPPKGGAFYSRVTTFIDVLDDKSTLADWKVRLTVIGLMKARGLLDEFAALEDPNGADKGKMNALCERARKAAGSDLRADLGTVFHENVEQILRGEGIPPMPDEDLEDVNKFLAAMEGFEPLGLEQFVVNDEYKIAGTADLFCRVTGDAAGRLGVESGTVVTADLKTGSSVDFSRGKYGQQLAAYASSSRYDPRTAERSPLEWDAVAPSQEVGVIFHLPIGEARCAVYRVDLQAGLTALDLSSKVRKYRSEWNRKKEPLMNMVSLH